MTTRLVRWLILRLPPALLRNPWGICVKLAASAAGLLILFWPGIPLPPTIASELGTSTGRVWAGTLALGGLVGLFGYFSLQWRLEIAGLLFLATAALVYGVVLLVGFGGGGVAAGAGFLAVFLAALLRSLAVASEFMLARRHSGNVPGGDEGG